MSQAEKMLDGIMTMAVSGEINTEDVFAVIGEDRYIVVPETMKKLGVQHDHNIETHVFIAPRYWDGYDLSEMVAYVNYMLPNGDLGSCFMSNVPYNDTQIRLEWTITNHVTQLNGQVTVLVCLKSVDENNIETLHWNSELCTDFYVSEGMECEVPIVNEYPDLVTSILLKLSNLEKEDENIYRMLPTKLSQLQNDSGFITETIANGKYVKIDNDASRTLKLSKTTQDNTLRVDGVSSIPHTVRVTVANHDLWNQRLENGVIEDKDFGITDTGTGVYKSIKSYLPAGNYVLEFSGNTNVVRKVIDGFYVIVNDASSIGTTRYPFKTTMDGYVGFTFRDSSSATTTWDDSRRISICNVDNNPDDTANGYPTVALDMKVYQFGKNLFPDIPESEANGVTLSKIGDYYVLNGTATTSGLFTRTIGLQSGTYTLSANNLYNNGLDMPIVQVYSDTTKQSIVAKDNANNSYATMEIDGATDYQFRIRYENGVTYKNYVIKPQFELGNTVTEYEPYTMTEHELTVIDHYGYVDIESVSPTMTLMLSNTGTMYPNIIDIAAEYNGDISETVKNILNELESLKSTNR